MNAERKYGLDVIKIAATILIIFHHYQQVTGVTFDGINFWDGKFAFGYVVELFFVISGYVIYPYIDKINEKGIRLSEFYINRFIRLFPMVLITAIAYELVLYIYVCGMGRDWFGMQPTLWGTIIDCMMIQCGWGFANPGVNNPTWYVSVLMLCYVIFYVLVCIAKKCKFDVIYLFIMMLLLGVGVHTYSLELPLLNSDTYRGFYSFFWGLILRRVMPIIQKSIMKHKYVSIFIGIAILSVVPLLLHTEHVTVAHDVNYVITFVYYSVIICLFEMPQVIHLFKYSFLKVLCEISFNVYLWHITLLIATHTVAEILFEGQIGFLYSYRAMFLFTMGSFVWGGISYYLIEKPIVSQIKKRRQYEQKNNK